jgi:hypothetical protein
MDPNSRPIEIPSSVENPFRMSSATEGSEHERLKMASTHVNAAMVERGPEVTSVGCERSMLHTYSNLVTELNTAELEVRCRSRGKVDDSNGICEQSAQSSNPRQILTWLLVILVHNHHGSVFSLRSPSRNPSHLVPLALQPLPDFRSGEH